jgi:hypothetical protein
MPDPKPEFDLAEAVADANRLYFGCKTCKGIRYKSCHDCGQKPNSFGDFRDSQRPRQVYETQREWREVNGTPEQKVPDRKLQP